MLVDWRRASGSLARTIRERDDIELHIGQLEAGHYVVNDRVVVEVTTPCHLARALHTGTLDACARRLGRTRWRPAMIVQGASPGGAGAAAPRGPLARAIVRMTLAFDVPVLQTRDEAETVEMLAYCAR